MKNKTIFTLMFLIFLNGYVSLSSELLVMRQLSFYVGSSAVITSIIMGCFLGFMALGYFVGMSKRIADNQINQLVCLGFMTVALFTAIATSFPMVDMYWVLMGRMGISAGIIQTFLYSIIFLSIGPFVFGFNTTLLSRLINNQNKNYTGGVMAWDTIGSVIGSMATTLILMPFVGVNNTVIFVVALGIIGAFIMRVRIYNIGFAILLLLGTGYINSDAFLQKRYGILVNNANSTIYVNDTGAVRTLYMNGLPMSVLEYGRPAEYIDYINTNFIYNMPHNRRYNILVLGAGGFTAGLNDTFNSYTFVDIERSLQDVAERYFLHSKLTKNKKFIVQDASQFLKHTDEKYDLILLDVYSNSYQIPEGLITAEFMQRIKSRIAADGVIIMNMVMDVAFNDEYTRVFDNTFHAVFNNNTTRQIIGNYNPWNYKDGSNISNVLYIYHNIKNDGRIYTINKTPVIYDKY
ncbi:MAG: fused MFS/spermidine synthase [Alphaproteobacteria bacterium]|nr:fused MFS/spermidine synthase [Alphaproteobacteria bacterium]